MQSIDPVRSSLAVSKVLRQRTENLQRIQAMDRAGVQAPTGDATQRSAELGTVPAARQAAVASRVRCMVTEKVKQLDAFHREELQPMIRAIGTTDFYNQAARLDPVHASEWHEMARVQQQFAPAEAEYDPQTRAYSESMRLTLQAGAVMQFARAPNGTTDCFSNFIAGHVTAFRENGGWFSNNRIGLCNSANVLWHTPASMYPNFGTIAVAAWKGNDDLSMRTGAEMVRRARRPLVQP